MYLFSYLCVHLSLFICVSVCLGVIWKVTGSCLQVDVIKFILLSEMVLGELK